MCIKQIQWVKIEEPHIVAWLYNISVAFTRAVSEVNQQGEDEAAQCGLQQTPTAVKTEQNYRGYI